MFLLPVSRCLGTSGTAVCREKGNDDGPDHHDGCHSRQRFDVGITPDGLSLGIGEEALFSGLSMVKAGRLELSDIRAIDDVFFMGFLTDDDFERVIEGGLNDALTAHDLVPTGVALRDGELIVNVSQSGLDASKSIAR